MSDLDHRVLMLDPAPQRCLADELDPLTAAGVRTTVNLWRLDDRAAVRRRYGGRVEFVDFDAFDEEASIRELTRDGEGYDALKIRANIPITARLLQAGARGGQRRRLRVVGKTGSGVDRIDLPAADRLGVLVTHTPGANAEAVAEHALALLFAAIRSVVRHDRAAQRGEWPGGPVPLAPELAELTLGIIGPGLVGQALARKATALGMTVIALGSARFDAAAAWRIGVRRADSLGALLAACDVVSLHCPLTEHTRGLIGAAEFALMRPGSVLLNLSRGGVVDEHALAAALADDAAAPAAAAADVFEHEHAGFDSPLIGLENAILTPHVAGLTAGAARRAAGQLSRAILTLLDGGDEAVPLATARR
jgi:phosphoglycerate dehydrogenase-like enzyme